MPSGDSTTLSICVIGRNEALNLPRLIESLKPLEHLPFPIETLYVDSASTDFSVDVARKYFDAVYVLEESDNLCAAAGRNIGTTQACGDWILYLDGDMALCEEFTRVIELACVRPSFTAGWIGKYRYIYDDGSVRLRHNRDGTIVSHFGGAVLLPREAVLKVGNWNPRLFSNEEIDLYTKLRGVGCVVRSTDTPMIEHYTEKVGKFKMIIETFVPGRYLGKKFYGFGQVLSSRVKHRSLINFVWYFPYPFVYVFLIFLAIAFTLAKCPWLGVTTLFLGIAFIYKKKGVNYLILYLAFISQALLGWHKYNKDYMPTINRIWRKNNDVLL